MTDNGGMFPTLGSEVSLHGLRSRAAYNGCRGEVTRHCKDGLHLEVFLFDQGDKLRVKFANVRSVGKCANLKQADSEVMSSCSVATSTVEKIRELWQDAKGARDQIRKFLQQQGSRQARYCSEEMDRIEAAMLGMATWIKELHSATAVEERPQLRRSSSTSSGLMTKSRSSTRLREDVARAQDLYSPSKANSTSKSVDKLTDLPDIPRGSPLARTAVVLDEGDSSKEAIAAYLQAIGDAAVASAVEKQLRKPFPVHEEEASLQARERRGSRPPPMLTYSDSSAEGDETSPSKACSSKSPLIDIVTHAHVITLDFRETTSKVTGRTFVDGLKYFGALTTLTLDLGHLSPLSGAADFGQGLAKLKHLRELVVRGGSCTDLTSFDGLCTGLQALTQLSRLDLDFSNSPHLRLFDTLGCGLANLVSLNSLVLAFCGCSQVSQVDQIGKSLQCMQALSTLDLNLSRCTGLEQVNEVGKGIATLSSLTSCSLDLSHCDSLQNIDEIGRAMVNRSLKFLQLSISHCGQVVSVQELRSGLSKNTGLETVTVDLSNCEKLGMCSCRIKTLQELQEFLKPVGNEKEKDESKREPKAIVIKEIIDDDYEPTLEEIEEYAAWLGMDLLKERELFWIARLALKEPVPKPWKPCRMENSEDVFYFNFETGESIWDHPADLKYKNIYKEQKQQREKKERPQESPQEENPQQAFLESQKDKCEEKLAKKTDEELAKETRGLSVTPLPTQLEDAPPNVTEKIIAVESTSNCDAPDALLPTAAPPTPMQASQQQAAGISSRARRFCVAFPTR